ncbi:hypothetical protein [Acidaminococcus intestini]|uniref:Uncharacterized protein n=1 Tax=Acidaminococcus intestini (strain RyC-MR95) TaxID=568816 RepID=G4Q8T6_ACIIR|nr:hypothetical protein [Acidaminococcus intestini]AEQ22519.1 hypothetical protein Acin_1295 [Acidaminococcus intestini RyC-MR95]
MCSAKSKLIIAYTGPLVDDGTMDVQELGPALMALSALVNEANKVLNDDNSTIAVKVNADFKKGSFEIQLELIRTLAAQLQSLFTPNVTMEQLIAYLGLAGSVQSLVGGPNLVDVIKWVKNRVITKATKHKDGTVTLESETDHITVNVNVVNIYQSVPVRESFDKLVEPTRREGIDSFQVRADKDKTVVQSIKKEEAKCFEFDSGKIGNVKEKVEVTETDEWVNILTVNFEDLKWRFMSDENKFYAKMDDEDFIKQIDNGDQSFTKGDMLKIRRERTQIRKADGTIKNEYKVIKVLEFQKRAKEIELPFEDGE